jgi:crotonobetainyl-CoA hydratase
MPWHEQATTNSEGTDMTMSRKDILLVEKNTDKHYAILTINREERGNSINFELGQCLKQAWADLKHDDDIWTVILTGKGDRFFCAGADLKDRADLNESYDGGYLQYVKDHGGWADMTPVGSEFWKPVICAVNGYAVAGGFMLSQMCDVRIASEGAKFGIPEARWNLPAPFVAQAQKLVPPAWALEATMWGSRQYSAQRMYELGYVNKVVPSEKLLSEAIAWAEEACEMGPVSVWTHKELMYRYLYPDDATWKRIGWSIFDKLELMEDAIEGPAAFAQRRKPSWKLK